MPCSKTQPLPHHTPQQATWDKMARQNPDTEVLARAGLPSIHTLLEKSQL